MIAELIERKNSLNRIATEFHRAQLYVPGMDQYVIGFFCKPEAGCHDYNGEVEPIINPKDLYQLPTEAKLTVNAYNALVLNSTNMLIADIDFGDQRLNQFAAGAGNCDDVVRNLNELAVLDEDRNSFDSFHFASQSYRVYRTHSGCRVICTSKGVPWDRLSWDAERFMRFLGGDPRYIGLCGTQKCYRARLSPKPWRTNFDGPNHVCDFVATVGNDDVAEDLKSQLELHDELTLPDSDWSCLA
jgi:hypothetical protein